MLLNHDLHIHTYLSSCCEKKDSQRPELILELAENMGLEVIGFSDHIWANPAITPSDWYRPQGEAHIKRLREDLEKIDSPIRVFVGCEAEMIAPGRFGITHNFASILDYVLLSCSHFHMRDFVAQPAGDGVRELSDHILDFFRSGVSSGLATSIAHPLIPFSYHHKFDKAVECMSDGELVDTFGLACENDVALEITTSFLPSDDQPAFSIETPIRILSLAKKAGCKFTLGSDAHEPEKQKRLPELARLTSAANINKNDMLVSTW